MKAKIDILAKPCLCSTSFHTTVKTASLRAESAPIHAIVNAVHKYLSFAHWLATMTSRLQPTQVQGLCYTRGI